MENSNKTTYFLMQHSRGNHSAQQVYYHGKIIVKGTKKECNKERAQMVRYCKDNFCNVSTNDNKKEYVSYHMADVFCIKKDKNGLISFFY